MAPRYEALSHENFDDDEDELDFSDLRQQYEVKMDEGLDAFVVCNSTLCKPSAINDFLGDRRAANCYGRAKAQACQVPSQETQFCWQN